jgi:hypothetical protein
MSLPAIGAKAPERLTLPDMRRLDRMPSLPAWVASRVGSVKDEPQRSLADGKYRTVPTLPANLILNPAERAEIDQHAGELEALCAQTPADSDEWEAATLIIITKLMLALPAAQQNEAGAEATGEAFQAALDDVPSWAVAAAVRRWYRGDCGKNERGQPYDYHWRPAPAELRKIALVEKWRVQERAQMLRKLIAAEALIEFSDEHCAAMRARLAAVIPRAARTA